MATRSKKASKSKETAKKATRVSKRAKPKKPQPSMPRYTCQKCGVMITVTKEGIGIHRLMCCGEPMKRA